MHLVVKGTNTGGAHHRDFLVGSGFALTSAIAHLVWNPMSEHWQFIATAIIFTAFLVGWLIRDWHRLKLFMTKFYCVAAALDVLAEGVLQPVHHCTRDNLICTGRMYLVFFAFCLVAQPLEGWLRGRFAKTKNAVL